MKAEAIAEANAGTVFTYEIDAIPDPNEHQLAAQCRGDVRRSVFSGFEHLLRMIARFREGEIALAIRFLFSPDNSAAPQGSLRLQVALKVGRGLRPEIARQLIEVGPICEFYVPRLKQEWKLPAAQEPLDECRDTNAAPARFPFACDIIRREDRVETELPRGLNKYVPASGFYYSPNPLVPREDNDYLALDTLLSRLEEPCRVELLAAPVDHDSDLHAHDKYLRQLRAVNGYGDDVYLGTPRENQLAGFLGTEADSLSGLAVPRETRKRDPAADEILYEQQEYHRQLRQPQLLFNAKVFAMQPEAALMIASAVAECGFAEGKYRLLAYGDHAQDSDAAVEASRADADRLNISIQPQDPSIWKDDLPPAWNAFRRLSRLAGVDELKGLFRLPVGGFRSPRCVRRTTDPAIDTRDIQAKILIGDDLESETPPPRRFDRSDLSRTFNLNAAGSLELRLTQKVLTKHLFVAGVPGSGKTTAVFNILVQLHRQGIPFLVIEPAKTEYRALKILKDHPDPGIRQLACNIRVFTPGNEELSPLRFNPLEIPAGITLDEHIGQLLACFEAAMPMGGPLQALIAESLEDVYAGRPKDSYPQMNDLVQSARRIMASKGYEGEVRSNLQAAIEVRLGLLTRRAIGRLFRATRSIPSMDDILAHPTIVELDYLPQDHACLLTLFLLAAVREHIRTSPGRRKPGLHHVTVIEEAHNIVGRTAAARGSEEVVDPKAFAAEYVSRMLAELRALGEGLIIADQLPSTVAPQVVKNTGTKLAHRLVSADDREDLGGAMLMGPPEMEELARLGPGTAYLYTEGLYRPRRVRCLNSVEYLDLQNRTVPVGYAIVADLESAPWFVAAREERILSSLAELEIRQRHVLECAEHAEGSMQTPGYEQTLETIATCTDLERRSQVFAKFIEHTTAAMENLEQTFDDSYQEINEREVPAIEEAARTSERISDRYEAFVHRHNHQVVPRYNSAMKALLDIRRRARELVNASPTENQT
jgi:hypothetical protein